MKMKKEDAIELHDADCEENRLPSPPSIVVCGKWTNVCPVCLTPCSEFPWECLSQDCEWTAATGSNYRCCIEVDRVVEDEENKNKAHYPVKASAIVEAKAKPPNERSRKERKLAELDEAEADLGKKRLTGDQKQ